MATLLGILILDLAEPDRAGGTEDSHVRKLYEMNAGTGTRFVEAVDPADTAVRVFEWMCFSRSEAKTLRQFIDGRLGRALPFWLVSFAADFTLTASAAAADRDIYVEEAGYVANVFPMGPYRRYIAIRYPGGVAYRKVTAAVVSSPGVERLTLDTAIGADIVPEYTLVSFMRLSRLDSDDVRIEWTGGHFAKCSMPVRELPNEVQP